MKNRNVTSGAENPGLRGSDLRGQGRACVGATVEGCHASSRRPVALLWLGLVVIGWLLGMGVVCQTAHADQSVEMCLPEASASPGARVRGRFPGSSPHDPWDEPWASVLQLTIDGQVETGFCTDVGSYVREGRCYASTLGVTGPKVTCLLQHYPPEVTLDPEEAAARQAAVWHLSSDFELLNESPTTQAIFDRYTEIVDDINARWAAGECQPALPPTLDIEPAAAFSFLAPDGMGGYLPSSQTYTITMMSGTQPVSGQAVTVAADIGVLTGDGQSGDRIQVLTGADGVAVVTLTHNDNATAMITVTTAVSLPVGIRLDPGAEIQKVAVGGSLTFELEDTATARWVHACNLVVVKFHDKNRDGVYNGSDELINWWVKYRVTGETWSNELELGSDGVLVIEVDPTKTYEVCEVPQDGWIATTPTCYEGLEVGAVVWFGNAKMASLLIEKYHDLNGNGGRDGGEPGLDGWGFTVDCWYEDRWGQSYSGLTANGGLLGFTDVLCPRLYRVSEVMVGGWYSSTASTQYVEVEEGGVHTLTFGNLQTGELRIEKSWLSHEGYCAPPGAGATICITRTGPGTPAQALVPTDESGSPLTLNEQGYYCQVVSTSIAFKNLWPGTYAITETAPSGWTAEQLVTQATLASGEVVTVTIANTKLGTVTIIKEANPEGSQSFGFSGDLGSFSLVDAGGGGNTTTFTDLPTGTYQVVEQVPDGWELDSITIQDATGGSSVDLAAGSASIDLAMGEHVTCAFRNGALASLGDYVWKDADADGVWNPGESGVGGVTVNLYDGENGLVLSTTTTITGLYRFTGLTPGEYYVEFILPEGYVFTSQNQGADDTVDSDADPATGRTELTSLDPGEADLTWDAGIYRPGALDLTKVVVWNGVTPEASQVFTLCITGPSYPEGDCRRVGPEGDTLSWEGLVPGQYTVSELATGSQWDVVIDPQQVTVPDGGRATTTITNTHKLSSLGDYVWHDINEDGIQDEGELGFAGITVNLYDGADALQDTTTTDADGFYQFLDLVPGEYYVEFELPESWASSPQDKGDDDALDSDADPATGRTVSTTLAAGEYDPTWDAGLYLPPGTGVTVTSFQGTRKADSIVLKWETQQEEGISGFALLRGTTTSWDDAVDIGNLVPAKGHGQGGGASYEYVDNTAQPDVTYTYWLLSVDTIGTRTVAFSPVTVSPLPASSPCELHLPLIWR